MTLLAGKVCIITGGGGGIGRASAALFVAEGAKVVVADLNRAAGEATVDAADPGGGQAIFIETDITQPDSVSAMVSTTMQEFGQIDVLHNNAGGSSVQDASVVDIDLDVWYRTINVDLHGTMLTSRFTIPHMTGRGGSIINMSSVVAVLGTKGRDAYTAAKGAVSALTRSMAAEFRSEAIRVNAILPGTTKTGRVVSLLEAHAPHLLEPTAGIPMLNEPVDVANAVLFLASDLSRNMTGGVMTVDGGTTTIAMHA